MITPALIFGGLFLCYEGFEKVAHKFLHSASEDSAHHEELVKRLRDPSVDLVAYERQKINGAIRTDFILSLEIIVLTLGIVAEMAFISQVLVLSIIALAMTVGVYGLVAGIVKLDDAGIHLMQRNGADSWSRSVRWVGSRLVSFAPWLMKFLAVVGTIAMFMVGGGILVHGFHLLDEGIVALTAMIAEVATVGPVLAALTPTLGGVLIGVVAGAVVTALVSLVQRLRAA